MKKSFVNTWFAVLIISRFITQSVYAKDFRLYFLGGQSNMTGFGYTKDLQKDLNSKIPGVFIYQGSSTLDYKPAQGLGLWEQLQPGHGEGFTSDGTKNYHSDRFGLELSFGKHISELYPSENIAIVKYSRNGSSIDASSAGVFGCWEPDFKDSNGINQYDHFLSTIRNAMLSSDIDSDGENDKLIPAGIIWMQGESDGTSTYDVAKKYFENLKRLVNLIRAALRYDNLPIVIGRISDSQMGDNPGGKIWKYGDIIKLEQEEFVKNDSNAFLITSTDGYKYSDKWHYDSEAYIDLGIKFAEAFYRLQIKKGLIN